MSVRCIGRVDV